MVSEMEREKAERDSRVEMEWEEGEMDIQKVGALSCHKLSITMIASILYRQIFQLGLGPGE